MSDVFEGPGWWLASDGKWYPPHLHHDPNYRETHGVKTAATASMPEPEVKPVPGSVAEMLAGVDPDDDPDASTESRDGREGAAVEVDTRGSDETDRREPDLPSTLPEPGRSAEPTPVSTILDRAERAREARMRAAAPDESSESNVSEVRIGGEASRRLTAVEDAPAGVADEKRRQERPSTSRAKLEVGTMNTGTRTAKPRQPTVDPVKQPSIRISDEPLSTSTDLVPVPSLRQQGPEPVDTYDRAIAGLLFLAGVAMIVGTFMPWENVLREASTGWELGDGLATVVAGVLGSAAAGPIFVGFRHVIPKTIAIITGLVGAVVVGLSGLQVVTDSEAAQSSLGFGFWIVLVGSIVMLAAGLADRSALD